MKQGNIAFAMESTDIPGCYDDEFFIRVFVRMQRERTVPMEKKHSMETAIYNSIYQSSNYILPHVIKREGDEAKRFLLNTLTAIYHSDRLLAISMKEANEQMHIQLKVIAPATIVYMDSRSGTMVSYDEYERRYYGSIFRLKEDRQGAHQRGTDLERKQMRTSN